MAKRLLSLRGVTQEEADGLREALDAASVDFYEVPPTAFGISAGSVWIRRDDDFERAKRVFDAFQEALVVTAREQNTAESLWSYARRNPGRVVAYTAAALGVLLVMFWPVFHLWG